MSFENIIGNEEAKSILDKAIKTNNVVHSYIFSGIDGIGKKKFAIEFAKMILCLSEDNNKKPCNECKSCIEFDSNNNPELTIIEPEAKGKGIKIDQIRELQEKIYEKPIVSNKKVYIINDSDTMNEAAGNCLLKTLEEPPEYAVIILVTSNENRLLNTIKSRCIKINFNKISNDKIEKYIIDNNIVDKVTKEMVLACEGSIGKAITLVEKKEQYENVQNFVKLLDSKSILDLLLQSKSKVFDKDTILENLDYMNVVLFNKNKINCISHVEEAKKRIIANSNFDMTIDNLIMNMWEEINENNRGN